MDDLLREFLSETTDQISGLDGTLRKFANTPGDAKLQGQILQLFHTIKGAGGFLALPRLEAIATAAERYLGKLKTGAISPVTETSEVISDAIREIVALLEATARLEREPAGDDSEVLATLVAATLGELKPKVPSPPESPIEPEFEQQSELVAAKLPEAVKMREGQLVLVADRIDEITDLVGELVLTRNNLNYLMLTRDDPELEAPVRQLDLIASDLGQRVFETRELTQIGAPAFDLIPAIAVEWAGSLFALPRTNVIELSVASWSRDFLLAVRDEPPAVPLGTLLGRPVPAKKNDVTVAIECDGRRASIVVERAMTLEELVVRPLPPLLSKIPLYCGIGISGDGRIALVLDPAEIVRLIGASVRPLALTTQS